MWIPDRNRVIILKPGSTLDSHRHSESQKLHRFKNTEIKEITFIVLAILVGDKIFDLVSGATDTCEKASFLNH